MKRMAVYTRRRWITGVVAALGGAGVACLGWGVLSRPPAPFAFLEGAELLPQQEAAGRSNSWVTLDGMEYTEFRAAYALHTDFATVRARAERELRTKGFRIESTYWLLGGSAAHYSRVNAKAGEGLV